MLLCCCYQCNKLQGSGHLPALCRWHVSAEACQQLSTVRSKWSRRCAGKHSSKAAGQPTQWSAGEDIWKLCSATDTMDLAEIAVWLKAMHQATTAITWPKAVALSKRWFSQGQKSPVDSSLAKDNSSVQDSRFVKDCSSVKKGTCAIDSRSAQDGVLKKSAMAHLDGVAMSQPLLLHDGNKAPVRAISSSQPWGTCATSPFPSTRGRHQGLQYCLGGPVRLQALCDVCQPSLCTRTRSQMLHTCALKLLY